MTETLRHLMKIYLYPTCYGLTSRIDFYEMEQHLSFDNYDDSLWNEFIKLFKKMDALSVWGGADKSDIVDYIPSMKSWEVKSDKAEAYFEYVQVSLEHMGVSFEVGYPSYGKTSKIK